MFRVMGRPGSVLLIGSLAIEAPCVFFFNELNYFVCCVTHGSLHMGPRQDHCCPDLPVLLKPQNQFLLAEVVEGFFIRMRVQCRASAVQCRQDQESESCHQVAAL